MQSIENEEIICPNCEFRYPSSYNFCPNCGQDNLYKRRHIHNFLMDFLASMFNFDSKILTTFKDLFIPGRIVINFTSNKRARYVLPVKFFLFVSFLYFLLLSFNIGKRDKADSRSVVIEDSIAYNISSADINTSITRKDTTEIRMLNEIKASPHPDNLIEEFITYKYPNSNRFTKNFYRNIVKINTRHIDSEELLGKIYRNISYSMFLLMPLFALFLNMLYFRSRKHYSNHLVFSMYFHSLAFLILIVSMIFNWAGLRIDLFFILAILTYLLIMLKKVYGQRWAKTSLKFIILAFNYSLSILIVLALGVALSIIV
ncbi:MAG: DUF3667 domain-containing protein [Rikenellaceae bacterium]|nr:DUF3667 domain-containing protein [Rikenellaceae bacterium]